MLVVVANDEGHLRRRCRGVAVVASNPHEFVAVFDHEGQSVHVVNLGEVRDLGGREFRVD